MSGQGGPGPGKPDASNEKKDIPPTSTPTDYMIATTWIQPEWKSWSFKWSFVHHELIQHLIALGPTYYAHVPTPIDVVDPNTKFPCENNHWDKTIYYQSPDGAQWWHTNHSYNNYIWVVSGEIGERGSAFRRECDTQQQSFAISIALAAQKQIAGWKYMMDPRGEYQSHQWDASFSCRYYRWCDAPPADPYVGLWSYFLTGIVAESILFPDSNVDLLDRNATKIKRWWSSPAEAKTGIDAWCDEKMTQGYVQIQRPPRAFDEAQGKWVYLCPYGKKCPHIPSQDHKLKYYHPHPDELDDIEAIQKTCENPLLVEAWKRDRLLMKQQLRDTTPSHMHSMLDEIVDLAKPSMRTYWKPIVTRQRDVPVTRSKVHGSPYIPKGEEWPECSRCHRKLWFLFQMNCSQLPQRLRGIIGADHQMIQFYICATNNMKCGETSKKSKVGTVVRMVTWSQDGGRSAQEVGTSQFLDSDDYHLVDCKEGILTWEEGEEQNGPCVQYDPQYPQMQMKDEVFSHWKIGNGDSGSRPQYGDKIAGFACYYPGERAVVLPRCSKCQGDMRYIIQVASQYYLAPFRWGDSGCGQIFQCPIHKESLAFDWSC